MPQLLLCSILMQNIQIFYGGPVKFIVTCFFAQPDCRNILPEHCNTIIEQQLWGQELPSLLPLLQADVFQEKQGTLQQIKLCSSNKPGKKACIKPCGTNNSTQSITRMYQHTAILELKVYIVYVYVESYSFWCAFFLQYENADVSLGLFFCCFFYFLQKQHNCKKSGSWVMVGKPQNKSEYRIL